MRTIVQIEFSDNILREREAILRNLGFNVISILGAAGFERGNFYGQSVAAVVIGHGAPIEERQRLALCVRRQLPESPIVALLRRSDTFLTDVNANCPADNPVLWLRTINEITTLVPRPIGDTRRPIG
jgi:hypothetical protein